MKCPEVLELIQRYLDRDVSELEEQIMFRHLGTCRSCARMFERLKRLDDLLDHELSRYPNVTPPFSIVDSILPKLEQMEWSKETEHAENAEPETDVPEQPAAGKPIQPGVEQAHSPSAEPAKRKQPAWIRWRIVSGTAVAAAIMALVLLNWVGLPGNRLAEEDDRDGVRILADVGQEQDNREEAADQMMSGLAFQAEFDDDELEVFDQSGPIRGITGSNALKTAPGKVQGTETTGRNQSNHSLVELTPPPEAVAETTDDQVDGSLKTVEPGQVTAASSEPGKQASTTVELPSPGGEYIARLKDGVLTITNANGQLLFTLGPLLDGSELRLEEWTEEGLHYKILAVSGSVSDHMIDPAGLAGLAAPNPVSNP